MSCRHVWRRHPSGTTFCGRCGDTAPFLRQSCTAHGSVSRPGCPVCDLIDGWFAARVRRLSEYRLDGRVADVVDLFGVR